MAGETLDEKIEKMLATIKRRATEKNRLCRAGYDHDADQDLWIYGGYNHTPDWNKAKAALEKLGFKVSFYYRDGSIAVDMYTLIEW